LAGRRSFLLTMSGYIFFRSTSCGEGGGKSKAGRTGARARAEQQGGRFVRGCAEELSWNAAPGMRHQGITVVCGAHFAAAARVLQRAMASAAGRLRTPNLPHLRRAPCKPCAPAHSAPRISWPNPWRDTLGASLHHRSPTPTSEEQRKGV